MKPSAYKLLFSLVFCFSFLNGFSQWSDNNSYLTTSDYVGIGTTSPGEKLQIGDSYTFHDGGHKVIGFLYRPSTSADLNVNAYSAEIRFDPVLGKLRLGTSSTVTYSPVTNFTLDKNGNVGIGTSDPLDKLQISGNLRLDGSYSNDEIRFESQNGFHRIAFRELRLYDWDAGGDNLTINNGNVGIGTVNPTEKLQVMGDIAIQYGQSIKVTTDWNGNGESKILKTGWESGRDDYLDFYVPGNLSVNQTARLSILQNGNVGIGTTTPSEKLEVNGTIRTKEVKVEASPWPDYVFSNTYELSPLSEVSTYIQENHHLPGIPTAQEVAENGIKLGEMNAKLLEKVEELTLYLIEQNEKIEIVLKENAEIRKENEIQHIEIESLKAKIK